MARRKIKFENGELYHVYNRGVDKREIFSDKQDTLRFIESLDVFNTIEPIGSIFAEKKRGRGRTPTPPTPKKQKGKLVNIIAYCLNLNHYHFVLEEIVEGGISEFMKRLGGGYTGYYNIKYKRNGVLFQGKFKTVHIKKDGQLEYTVDYVNLNNLVHKKFDGTKKHFLDDIPARSSWNEYINENIKGICGKDIILDVYKKAYRSRNTYESSAKETLKMVREMRYGDEK